METLLLSHREVHAYLPMAECIQAMEGAFRSLAAGLSLVPLRTVIRLPDSPNAFGVMPAVVGSGSSAQIAAKIITVFPGNDATPFDSHIGVVLLFGPDHGELLAIADASSITAIRTSAVSGLATRLLARPDSERLALLGAGTLAMPHLEAVSAVRPIKEVSIWSRSAARAQEFARKATASRGVKVTAARTAQEAVATADVVCTITASRTPVLEGSWLSPGTHVNAVGASLASARELDTAAVRRARMFVDLRESALHEAGDFLIPRSEGAIADDHILGELGDLLTGLIVGRQTPEEITLFKSLGLAVEDVAAVRHVYDKALAAGAGTRVEIGGMRLPERT
jgi:ornithine cyclodeaminase